jgi:hypothetical protein
VATSGQKIPEVQDMAGSQVTERFGFQRVRGLDQLAMLMVARIGTFKIQAGQAATTCTLEEDVVTEDELVLIAKRVWYYSQYDEAAFFEWLDKLSCVSGYQGELDVLNIYVDVSKVDEYALRELLALFHRYAVDMKQLRTFDRDEFAEWFRDPRAHWHAAVFQDQSV